MKHFYDDNRKKWVNNILKNKLLDMLTLAFWCIVVVLVIIIEALMQNNCTLLPICIPWMYDRIVILIISIFLALMKKNLTKSTDKFSQILGTYILRIALFVIVVPSIVFLPNRFITIGKEYELNGTIIDQTSIKYSKGSTSYNNYVKIQIKGENTAFWYNLGKEQEPLGNKCILSVRKGIFGIRYAEKVDFIVE